MAEELQPNTRTMTISRGLTRIEIIDAEISNICADVQKYSAGNNKSICRLSNKKDVKENHVDVEKGMKSLFQKFKDLTTEKIKIKRAIETANSTTDITIGGRTMKIAEALIMQHKVMPDYASMVSNFNYAVSRAENDVRSYNMQFSKVEDPAAKAAVLADIAYFIKAEEVKELGDFITVFKAELNGTLNEVNAVTQITIVD